MQTGCTSHEAPSAGSTVIVFAAASTKDAVQEIADVFSKVKGVGVRIAAEDSSKLATQIVNDAPAHVYISANEKWASFVKDNGFEQESVLLLGNRLVIVAVKEMAGKVKAPDDLLKNEIKKLAVAGPNVPAGIYARQALTKLGLWDELEKSKRIVACDNVRGALTFVERGEAEAGIVYATDAMITNKVEVAYHFDASTHDPIRYPVVLLKAGSKVQSAKDFYQFLLSEQASQVFQRHGFTVLAGK